MTRPPGARRRARFRTSRSRRQGQVGGVGAVRRRGRTSGGRHQGRGGCALIGEGSGAIALHSHYAIQLSIGSPSGLRVRFGRNGPWQPCSGALVPSRAVHSIDVNDCDWSSVLFMEPETAAGKAISARLQGKLEVLPPDRMEGSAERLEHAWRIERRP